MTWPTARHRQVADVLAKERDGICPGCGRVRRALGDHRCEEALSVDEARERIDFDGGLLKRQGNRETPFQVMDELMDAVKAYDRMADSIRCGTAAMRRLRDALTDDRFPPTTQQVGSYKGLPVYEDPDLPADAFFAASKPDTDDLRRRFLQDTYGTLTMKSRPIATITGLTS